MFPIFNFSAKELKRTADEVNKDSRFKKTVTDAVKQHIRSNTKLGCITAASLGKYSFKESLVPVFDTIQEHLGVHHDSYISGSSDVKQFVWDIYSDTLREAGFSVQQESPGSHWEMNGFFVVVEWSDLGTR